MRWMIVARCTHVCARTSLESFVHREDTSPAGADGNRVYGHDGQVATSGDQGKLVYL